MPLPNKAQDLERNEAPSHPVSDKLVSFEPKLSSKPCSPEDNLKRAAQSVDNCSTSPTTSTCLSHGLTEGLSAASMDPRDKPWDVGFGINQQILKKQLEGDPHRFNKDKLIAIANSACELKEPDISVESEYTYQGLPLKNTPLSLITTQFYADRDADLIEASIQLLLAGASIYQKSNYKCQSTDKNVEAKHYTSFLSHLLMRFSNTIDELVSFIPSSSIQSNLPEFTISLMSIDLRTWLRRLDVLTSLFGKITPGSLSIDAVLLFRILLIKQCVGQTKLGNFNTVFCQSLSQDDRFSFFMDCLSKNNLRAWMLRYPDSIHWEDLEFWYLEVLLEGRYGEGGAKKLTEPHLERLQKELLWLAENGLTSGLIRLKRFDILGHNTLENWQDYAKLIVTSSDVLKKDEKIRISRYPSFNLQDFMVQLSERTDLSFHGVLGRTLILKQKNGTCLAFKCQNVWEEFEALESEHAICAYLDKKKNRLDLKSEIPVPQCVGKIGKFELNLLFTPYLKKEIAPSFYKMLSMKDPIGIYVYQASENYFIYLHDPILSQAAFNHASEAAMHDLAVLLKDRSMVYHQLGDIFHDISREIRRTDGGRYLILASFIRRSYEVRESGSVHQWEKAIQYVNMRRSGLADLGDYEFFNDYINKSIFQEITKPAETHASNLIYSNIIAEYLFVFTLVCGKRGLELTRNLPEDEKYTVWLGLSKQLLHNAALIIHVLNGIPLAAAKHYLRSVFDTEVCAKQMQFWMGHNYYEDLSKGYTHCKAKLEQLYKGAALQHEDTFFKKLRIPTNSTYFPEQNLGDPTGQNPMKEDNKLYYYVALLTFMLRNIGTKYHDATFKFYDCLKARNRQDAREALTSLKQNKYFHSRWQQRHIDTCEIELKALDTCNNEVKESKNPPRLKEYVKRAYEKSKGSERSISYKIN